jgi:hypothetical protein
MTFARKAVQLKIYFGWAVVRRYGFTVL